jgi:hypothetical protein
MSLQLRFSGHPGTPGHRGRDPHPCQAVRQCVKQDATLNSSMSRPFTTAYHLDCCMASVEGLLSWQLQLHE